MNDYLQSIIDRDPAAKSKLSVILTYPGVKAVFFHQFAHLEYISQPGFSVGDTYAVQLQFECNSFTMDINNSNSNNRALWVLQEIAG